MATFEDILIVQGDVKHVAWIADQTARHGVLQIESRREYAGIAFQNDDPHIIHSFKLMKYLGNLRGKLHAQCV